MGQGKLIPSYFWLLMHTVKWLPAAWRPSSSKEVQVLAVGMEARWELVWMVKGTQGVHMEG